MAGVTRTALLPMLARSQSLDATPSGAGWEAEGKIDGARCLIEVLDNEKVRVVLGRNGSSYSGKLPYLEAVLTGLPVGTILDGELIAPGGSASGHGSSAVMSVMSRSGAHRPTKRDPALVYVVFDILAMGYDSEVVDLRKRPWADRRAILEGGGIEGTPHLALSRRYECNADGLTSALADGYEGLVCKRTTGRYVSGRSPQWVKVKPQQTAEAKIIGFKPGEAGGRFDGMVGAFELVMLDENGQPNGVRTRAKCGTDDVHQDATDHPSRWMDHIIELVHHGLSADGVPRHPQVAGRRDDLMPPARAPKRAAPVADVVDAVPGQPSKRNYRAMKDPKLLLCIAELRARDGNAYDRCEATGHDPAADLAIAEKLARDRGLL